MKDKYVEDLFPRYFVFGKHADGRVDVSSTRIDPVATVSREHAEIIIADRDAVIDKLCAMAQAFDDACPEAFAAFWYGEAKQ